MNESSSTGGRMNITMWAALLIAVLAAIDLGMTYMREGRVRYLSLGICVVLLAIVAFQMLQARRGRG